MSENVSISKEQLLEVLNGFNHKHISVTVATANAAVCNFRRFENFKYKESFRKDDLIFKNYDDFDGKVYIKQSMIKEIYIEPFCGIDGYTIKLNDDTEIFLYDVDLYETIQNKDEDGDEGWNQ